MCEIRLHVELPKDENEMENEEDNSKEKDGEEKKEKESLTQTIYKKILERAKIGSFGG